MAANSYATERAKRFRCGVSGFIQGRAPTPAEVHSFKAAGFTHRSIMVAIESSNYTVPAWASPHRLFPASGTTIDAGVAAHIHTIVKAWTDNDVGVILRLHYAKGANSGEAPLQFEIAGTDGAAANLARWQSLCQNFAAYFTDISPDMLVWSQNEPGIFPVPITTQATAWTRVKAADDAMIAGVRANSALATATLLRSTHIENRAERYGYAQSPWEAMTHTAGDNCWYSLHDYAPKEMCFGTNGKVWSNYPYANRAALDTEFTALYGGGRPNGADSNYMDWQVDSHTAGWTRAQLRTVLQYVDAFVSGNSSEPIIHVDEFGPIWANSNMATTLPTAFRTLITDKTALYAERNWGWAIWGGDQMCNEWLSASRFLDEGQGYPRPGTTNFDFGPDQSWRASELSCLYNLDMSHPVRRYPLDVTSLGGGAAADLVARIDTLHGFPANGTTTWGRVGNVVQITVNEIPVLNSNEIALFAAQNGTSVSEVTENQG